MMNLSNEFIEDIVWVVVKLIQNESWGDYSAEAENQGFSTRKFAEKRAEHILKHDGIQAWVYPVKVPWSPQPVFAPSPPRWPLIQGAVTAGRGLELHAYDEQQPRLSQIVSDAWLSWRQQQATAGNLDEAGQAGPEQFYLEVLYQEKSPSKPASEQLQFQGF
jgi:hypothetical protein